MDEELFIELYGERDGTTRFMRSIDSEPSIKRFLDAQDRSRFFSVGIAGCSTGEEVYSYALLLESLAFRSYRVDGYDAHAYRVERALAGNYPAAYAQSLHQYPALLCGIEYAGARIHIAPHIRARTSFECHDFSLSPLPRQYELIVCTNALGQVQRGGRECAVEHLAGSLEPHGRIVGNHALLRSLTQHI